ncbi:HNH endonuclease [Microbacterium schleiferi]|uniref:HNH endonuclease n=1 Tax=Microbacterium schleiferi TaxID=69362 RepID=UPI00311E61E3
MYSNHVPGVSEAGNATLAAIVADAEGIEVALSAAQVARVRMLARAGHLAEDLASESAQRVREHDMMLRSISAELAGVLRTSDRSIQRQIGEARTWVDDYPLTLDAWEAGLITRAHATLISEFGSILPADSRSEFEILAIEICLEKTPGRARVDLQHLAEQLHPRTLAERHIDARRRRRVGVNQLPDGMSELVTVLPTLLTDAIYDRLTQQARAVVDARSTTAGRALGPAAATAQASSPYLDAGTHDTDAEPDVRSMDEIRADVLADMLLTGSPLADPTIDGDGIGTLGAIRAKVQIVVPALALLGRDDAPAGDTGTIDLVGSSPIDPATARRLAGASGQWWERIVTHPVTGAVLHTDTYQRTAAIDRHLRARDKHCRFPGCRMPAIRCEVDHTIDHALGGRTDVCNLAHLCQRHHSMKQFTAWKVRQLPGGVLEWTSPLGRIYTEHPTSPTVQFVPSPPPGPPAPAPENVAPSAPDDPPAPF